MNTGTLESTLTALLLGVAIAVVHMMFQLGVSVLTLLTGHSLGLRKKHTRLLHLNISYIIGTFATVLLILLGLVAAIDALGLDERTLWIITVFVSTVVGCAVCLVYYRRSKGTILWIPRSIAEYLSRRAKKTTYGIEAAALGSMTVIGELPFIIAPLLIMSALITNGAINTQLAVEVTYALFVTLPLVIVTILIGSGHKVSTIQRWREQNKTFLQYSSGLGLVVIALYILVFHLMGAPV